MSVSFSQNVNQSPVQENSTPAKNGDIDCCLISTVALAAILFFGSIIAGITLTVLGGVTANPLFIEIGVTLIVMPIICLLSAIAKRTVVFY